MMALVRGVMAASTQVGVQIISSADLASTGTGVAPAKVTPSQVAMNVCEGTMTSSPGPMS